MREKPSFQEALRRVTSEFRQKFLGKCLDGKHCPEGVGPGLIPHPLDPALGMHTGTMPHATLSGVTFGQHHGHYRRMVKAHFWGEVTGLVGIDDLIFNPVDIPFTVTISRLGFVSAAAVNFKIGIYRDNGDTPAGGALLAASGSQAAVGSQKEEWALAATIQLTPGLYWIAVMLDASVNVVKDPFRNIAGGTIRGKYIDLYGFANPLPDPCPAVVDTNEVPNSFVIVSSTP